LTDFFLFICIWKDRVNIIKTCETNLE
jgi:hypothetical protein